MALTKDQCTQLNKEVIYFPEIKKYQLNGFKMQHAHSVDGHTLQQKKMSSLRRGIFQISNTKTSLLENSITQ
jgi:hypothetical protein